MTEESKKISRNSREFIKAISVDSRLSIYLYLTIYKELTLEVFSKLLNKSKSTIHHHIKEMLNAGILEEYTKRGSKTKYYKIGDFRLREEFVNTFKLESFEGKDAKEQIQLLRDFVNISTTHNKIMQALLKLIVTNEELIYQRAVEKKKTPLESREDLVDHFLATYYGSEEDGKQFKIEMIQLIEKYARKQYQNKKAENAFAFLMLGLNIDDILKRKYLEE